MLIGISGKRGSGKDLLGTILASEHGFVRYSFARALKQHVRDFMLLTEEQTDGGRKEMPTAYEKTDGWFYTPREIMIEVGQFYRQFDRNFWVRKVLRYAMDEQNACITDCRFVNEADAIRAAGGVVIRLERKPELNIYKGAIDDATETELDHYSFDYVLGADFNLTPADLQHFAKEIIADTNAKTMV